MVLEQLDNHTQKINLDTNLTSYTKTNSKWIRNINVKYKCKIPKKITQEKIWNTWDMTMLFKT